MRMESGRSSKNWTEPCFIRAPLTHFKAPWHEERVTSFKTALSTCSALNSYTHSLPNSYSELLSHLTPQIWGVEGYVLISSCESTRIATTCWTTIDRRMLEPTKKWYPMSKTNKKLQQDGKWAKSWIRDWTHVSCISRQILDHWAAWVAPQFVVMAHGLQLSYCFCF